MLDQSLGEELMMSSEDVADQMAKASPLWGDEEGFMSEIKLHTDGIRAAQSQWASLSIEDRCETLRAIGESFAGRAETIVARVCEETQKSQVDAWFADLIPNVDLFTYWTGEGKIFCVTKRSAFPL